MPNRAAKQGLTLANVGERLAGAPQCKQIAEALVHWASTRPGAGDLSSRVHDAARSLDASLGPLEQSVVAPDAVHDVAPTRLAIMGWTLHRQQRHEDAEKLLRAAQATYPDHFWVNTALGTTLTRYSKKHAEAARYLGAARGRRPESIEAIHRLGRAFESAGNLTEAIETFGRGSHWIPAGRTATRTWAKRSYWLEKGKRESRRRGWRPGSTPTTRSRTASWRSRCRKRETWRGLRKRGRKQRS